MLRRATVRCFTKYSGKSPILFLEEPKGSDITVSEQEWVRLCQEIHGVPLTGYYESRYPGFSTSDVENARKSIRSSFLYTDNWQKTYADKNFPKEMSNTRARLEAELDPASLEKLNAIPDDDHAAGDSFKAFRVRQLQEYQKVEKEYTRLDSGKGLLASPPFDWDKEFQLNPTAAFEKRLRYTRLANSSISWDSSIPLKWLAVYRATADILKKDIDIDYLRYLEGHVRDQYRAEKWYTRLAEDGEDTLTHEEVEAWMPEYYDTLMVDYDNWWELVHRNTEQSQWDRYQNTDGAYQDQLKAQYKQEQGIAEDPARAEKAFAPTSPFQTFRALPSLDVSFVGVVNGVEGASQLAAKTIQQLTSGVTESAETDKVAVAVKKA